MTDKKLTFAQQMEYLGRRHGIHSVFTDFLEITVCALSAGAQEQRYLEIIGKYEKPEAYQLAEAFGALVIEMDNGGEGLLDCFGDFFMEHLSFGKNGQFFTPQPICDMMAQITNPTGFGKRVVDCCCGSGRMLLSAAKINRNLLFYGADNDRNCAMMCLINLCLNGMLGEVAWMNSLSNQFYDGWRIEPHPQTFSPYIRHITEAESEIVLKLPEKKPVVIPYPEEPRQQNVTQGTLFEF